MERVTVQAVLREAVGKDKDGRFHVPDGKVLSIHMSRAAGALVLHRIGSLTLGEGYVRLEMFKGEVFFVAYEDLRAFVIEEKEKKAGFV